MKMKKLFLYAFAIVLAAFVVFSVADRLPALIKDMPAIQAEAQSRTYGKDKLLVVVNKSNPYSAQPDDLVQIFENKTSSYLVKDKTVYISSRAMSSLNEMMDDFYAQTGINNVNVISGYRSIEAQKEIYKNITVKYGKTYAERFCQKPGCSEHHTGLAIDLSIYHRENGSSEDFTGEGEYGWLYENSWRYGFIRRYEADKEEITGIGYEPWHFRYVGKDAAEYIFKHGICLEEYVEQSDKS